MKVNTAVLPVLGLILVLVHKSYGLGCYQCESTEEPDCKEYFDHSNIDSITIRSEECTVDAAKYCIKTTGVWGGVVGTTRFCSSRDMGNQCQFVRYPDHDRVYRACIYTCSGEHCNTAASQIPNFYISLVLGAAAYIYSRWV